RHGEGTADPNDRRQTRFPLRALEQRDLRSVEITQRAQAFLREPALLANPADVPGELLGRGHRRKCCVVTDETSTDNNSRPRRACSALPIDGSRRPPPISLLV